MNDLIYVVGTIVFFGLMIAYVRGCDRLGHGASADGNRASQVEADREPR
jgi:hypothetical protein